MTNESSGSNSVDGNSGGVNLAGINSTGVNSKSAGYNLKLSGIVERITFHNEQNGWSVLKVASFNHPGKLVTVVIHQAKVFAGSTMEFIGSWVNHPKHGEQFKAIQAIEKKPASSAAIEKYLGSGLIKGVGPATAKRIVNFFKTETLDVFENQIDKLLLVPGIAEKKLKDIKNSWQEHKAVRDVMIFLQGYGISTLFAVKIFKTYGADSISIVSQNPYRLARDIYGIGFFSADKIALSMGFERNGIPRIEAAVKHVLNSARDEGHCYLTLEQIQNEVKELLSIDEPEKISLVLSDLLLTNEIKKRELMFPVDESSVNHSEKAQIHSQKKSESIFESKKISEVKQCFYAKSLYYDEEFVANKVKVLTQQEVSVDPLRVKNWVQKYCETFKMSLSEEQANAVMGIVGCGFSILTGGPGCGKTTSTKVLVQLLKAMGKKILLAAPTGRAAQRMTEVIGDESKTIHRLLEWAPEKNAFKKNEAEPLQCDFLIIDETSMLDISLAAHLLKAVSAKTQVLFIGDPDQLPAVGAGNVLFDLIHSHKVKLFPLTKIFRQAESSCIITFAHQINKGIVPKIRSPLAEPKILKEGVDCVFVDCEEATQDQARFLLKAKQYLKSVDEGRNEYYLKSGEDIYASLVKENDSIKIKELFEPNLNEADLKSEQIFYIPEHLRYIDLAKLNTAQREVDEIRSVLKSIHPFSSLNHGLTAQETLLRLYTKTIPELLGTKTEIQVLTPQVRGSFGTQQLNLKIQETVNPLNENKKQLLFGERVYREGDRVIQTRNNYDLGVYNGDIGKIETMDLNELQVSVYFENSKQNIIYSREDLTDLSLAYAITIHKSQGSEFQVVIIPVMTQHFKMLFRNLIYTGLTRAKKLALFVGSRKALTQAIRTMDQSERQTALQLLL